MATVAVAYARARARLQRDGGDAEVSAHLRRLAEQASRGGAAPMALRIEAAMAAAPRPV